MDPNYPHQTYYSSSAAQMSGYYPTASAAPGSTDAGPLGGDFQEQEPAHLSDEDPLGAPPSYHAGPYSTSYSSQYDSFSGRQTGYPSSQGGSQVDYSRQHGNPHQPSIHQLSYGDDLDLYDFRTGLRSGAAPSVSNTFSLDRYGYPQHYGTPPPGYDGQHAHTPSTSQTAPGIEAVDEPVNPGTSGGLDAQGSQAPENPARPGYPKEHVGDDWSMRSQWIFNQGLKVNRGSYTEALFRRDYNVQWGNIAVAEEDLWSEFLRLRLEYLGY